MDVEGEQVGGVPATPVSKPHDPLDVEPSLSSEDEFKVFDDPPASCWHLACQRVVHDPLHVDFFLLSKLDADIISYPSSPSPGCDAA